jgi:hypothetical protein
MGGLGKLNGKCKGKEWYHPKSSFPAKKMKDSPGFRIPKVCSIMHG